MNEMMVKTQQSHHKLDSSMEYTLCGILLTPPYTLINSNLVDMNSRLCAKCLAVEASKEHKYER